MPFWMRGDGEDGLRCALKDKPDLILLDVMLPKMDGFEVCRRIREKDPFTPVVMLTAREDEADKVYGLELRRGRLHHQAFFHARTAGPN